MEVFSMKINSDTLVSISEANQNFSKVARLVDENGSAVILKNNTPRYIVIDYNEYKKETQNANDDINMITKRLIAKHRRAFEELAK